MYSVKKEYEKAEAKKVFGKKVSQEAAKSLTYFDNEHCKPIINVPKRSRPFCGNK